MQGRAPSARAMREALHTVLASARQLRRDPTFVSQAVALRCLQFDYSNARWALHHKVFETPAEIQNSLETISAVAPREEPLSFAEQHAIRLEMIQMLFPPNQQGRPRLDANGLGWLREALGENGPPELEKAGEADAWNAVKSTNAYYAELQAAWALGMPRTKVSDLRALCSKYVRPSVVCSLTLSDYVIAYRMQHRAAAEGRATLLAYELALHKAKIGSYPNALTELKLTTGGDVRIDPFTGKFFGYRLEKGQPLIYSWSENGKDDGGKHSPNWGDDDEGGSDDYVFWPPQPEPK